MNYIARAKQINVIVRAYNEIGRKLTDYLINGKLVNNKSGLLSTRSRRIIQNMIAETPHLRINIEDSTHSIYLNFTVHDAELPYIKRQLGLAGKESSVIRVLWLEMREVTSQEVENKLNRLAEIKSLIQTLSSEKSLIEYNYT